MSASSFPKLVVLITIFPVLALIVIFLSRKPTFPATTYVVDPSPAPQLVSNDTSNQLLADLKSAGLICSTSALTDACRVDKVVGNYAKGIQPQGYWIAVKTDTKWAIKITGNGIPACPDIDKYSIPQDIYGNCIETTGELRF